MTRFRPSLRPAFAVPLRALLKSLRRKFQNRLDFLYFPFWLVFQCVCHQKKVVILYRLAALGDVVCTLPMCGEIRQRHPHRLLIFVTTADYKKLVQLSRSADSIYGVSWLYGTPWPYAGHFGGLVETVYAPQTSEEHSENAGGQIHLVDDLASSCQLTIPASKRQPLLFPPPELNKSVLARYELTEEIAAGKLLVGINCGRTWPVRMWDAAKWQMLVDKIHADYNAVVLQFGLTRGSEDEYEHLRGVRFLANRLKSDELVALVAGCDLIVSIDSGPVHVAGAVGTPVIGLFGAVNPRHRLPPASPAVGIFSEIPCRFCHHANPIKHWQSGCPNNIRCMEELEVQTVFQAVKTILQRP